MRTTNSYETRPVSTSKGSTQPDVLLPFAGKQTKVQQSGMVFSRDLSERSWEQIGISLRELTNSSAWWLADWLIFGETTYGWRRYREAVERTGLDYQTLRNYAWVARRFEHHRRRDTLSFAHHAEVTRLSPPEQDYWLRKAEQLNWSRNELRRAVRASLTEQRDETGDGDGDGSPETAGTGERRPKSAALTIELSAHQLDHYSKLAAANGLSVDAWATRVLDAADRRIP